MLKPMKQVTTTFPWHSNCELSLLIDAEHYLPAMLTAINQARDYILLEMYLVKPGEQLDKFSATLQQAAARGVRCYLLLDDFGCKTLQEEKIDALQHHNIQIRRYNPLSSSNPLITLYHLLRKKYPRDLHRTHRKLLLIDGQLAFTGGAGISDEFSNPHFGPWRETMVCFSGDVVNDWLTLFCLSWPESLTLPGSTSHCQTGPASCRLVAAYAQHHNPLQQGLLQMCQHAQQRIWLATAYFVPNWRLHRQLIKAAKRGVDVRLLLPNAHIDHIAVHYASRRRYSQLLRHGVKIHEYQPRFLHTKILLCDHTTLVGSSNFDRWGMRWNMEANLQIESDDFAQQVHAMLEADFQHSHRYDYHIWCQRSWWLRLQESFWGWIDRALDHWGNKRH